MIDSEQALGFYLCHDPSVYTKLSYSRMQLPRSFDLQPCTSALELYPYPRHISRVSPPSDDFVVRLPTEDIEHIRKVGQTCAQAIADFCDASEPGFGSPIGSLQYFGLRHFHHIRPMACMSVLWLRDH
jgi:hypothetical protein